MSRPTSHGAGPALSDRMAIDFVEADCDIGFGLVDLATVESEAGEREGALRALEDADRIMLDIEERLSRLAEERQLPFRPLVGELRREIELARGRLPPPAGDHAIIVT